MKTLILIFAVICSQAQSSELQFDTIRSNMKSMTSVQFVQYIKSIAGTKIKWEGWVDDVEKNSSGNYIVYIDMDSPTVISCFEIYFKIPDTLALKLIKDNVVSFEGEIKSIYVNSLDPSGTCDIVLKNPQIIGK